MILSHRHKFIFVKTKKTAGTSLEILLSGYCGEQDVITPISPEDERIRRALGYRGPQNYLTRFGGREAVLYNHMSAEEIIAHFGPEIWEEYFTFCFERNPWEKVISQYCYRAKGGDLSGLGRFLRSPAVEELMYGSRRLYLVDGRIGVDRVYRYEDLDAALREIFGRLDLGEPPPLPRAKTGYRTDRRGYREVMSVEEIALIADKFREEIAAFYPDELPGGAPT